MQPGHPPESPGGDAVMVRRSDLEYVLAHVADEIHGHPDPSHWRLPLFAEALERLNAAARNVGGQG